MTVYFTFALQKSNLGKRVEEQLFNVACTPKEHAVDTVHVELLSTTKMKNMYYM